ncbi:MAG: ABC transporter permease, partial [Brevibacterium aurantiacum]|nr:ABC transporter permease [Brevibacterium aurantiacum]
MSAGISEPGAEAAETSVAVKKPSGGGLGRYVVIRFLLIIPTIFILTTLVFFLMRITGDPITASLGGRLTKSQLAERIHAAGYDRPLLVQYFEYMGNLLKGDF